jgi:hypothetical protein
MRIVNWGYGPIDNKPSENITSTVSPPKPKTLYFQELDHKNVMISVEKYFSELKETPLTEAMKIEITNKIKKIINYTQFKCYDEQSLHYLKTMHTFFAEESIKAKRNKSVSPEDVKFLKEMKMLAYNSFYNLTKNVAKFILEGIVKRLELPFNENIQKQIEVLVFDFKQALGSLEFKDAQEFVTEFQKQIHYFSENKPLNNVRYSNLLNFLLNETKKLNSFTEERVLEINNFGIERVPNYFSPTPPMGVRLNSLLSEKEKKIYNSMRNDLAQIRKQNNFFSLFAFNTATTKHDGDCGIQSCNRIISPEEATRPHSITGKTDLDLDRNIEIRKKIGYIFHSAANFEKLKITKKQAMSHIPLDLDVHQQNIVCLYINSQFNSEHNEPSNEFNINNIKNMLHYLKMKTISQLNEDELPTESKEKLMEKLVRYNEITDNIIFARFDQSALINELAKIAKKELFMSSIYQYSEAHDEREQMNIINNRLHSDDSKFTHEYTYDNEQEAYLISQGILKVAVDSNVTSNERLYSFVDLRDKNAGRLTFIHHKSGFWDVAVLKKSEVTKPLIERGVGQEFISLL